VMATFFIVSASFTLFHFSFWSDSDFPLFWLYIPIPSLLDSTSDNVCRLTIMDFDACQQSFTSNLASSNEGFQCRLLSGLYS